MQETFPHAHAHTDRFVRGRLGQQRRVRLGNEVSYGGANWIANQWNYDEVPGGASGAWNNDGTC